MVETAYRKACRNRQKGVGISHLLNGPLKGWGGRPLWGFARQMIIRHMFLESASLLSQSTTLIPLLL